MPLARLDLINPIMSSFLVASRRSAPAL